MTQKITEGLKVRVFLTVYYGIVCALAIHRCTSVLSGREVLGEMPYLHIAMFAGFALISWWLIASLRRMSDRVAALFYGLFYAIRVGTNFVKGTNGSLLEGTGCALITAGMIAMIVGLVHASSHDKLGNSQAADASQGGD